MNRRVDIICTAFVIVLLLAQLGFAVTVTYPIVSDWEFFRSMPWVIIGVALSFEVVPVLSIILFSRHAYHLYLVGLRFKRGLCTKCGHSLAQNNGCCPACGELIPGKPVTPQRAQHLAAAVAYAKRTQSARSRVAMHLAMVLFFLFVALEMGNVFTGLDSPAHHFLENVALGIGAVGGVCFLVASRQWRRDRRAKAGQCPDCGYDLRATGARCPECGAAIGQP